jgi:hypothetical protein
MFIRRLQLNTFKKFYDLTVNRKISYIPNNPNNPNNNSDYLYLIIIIGFCWYNSK